MNRRGFFGTLAAVALLPFAKLRPRKEVVFTRAETEAFVKATLDDLGPPMFVDFQAFQQKTADMMDCDLDWIRVKQS